VIEVQLRRGVHGCIMVPLGCLTLGLVPLLTRQAEGHFIRRMDEAGVETRNGKRYSWDEFGRIERVRSRMGSASSGSLSDEYLIYAPNGRASLPLWRTVNAQEASEYLLSHLPPGLFQQQPS
jgi:hypothetical protein